MVASQAGKRRKRIFITQIGTKYKKLLLKRRIEHKASFLYLIVKFDFPDINYESICFIMQTYPPSPPDLFR